MGKHVNLKNATLKVEGGKSYVLFSDGNKIQLYSPNLKSFSKDAQTKLGTDGQKLTSIKGKFEDYSVMEIPYINWFMLWKVILYLVIPQ